MRHFGIEFVPLEPYWKTVYYAVQAERSGFKYLWVTDHFNNRNVHVTLSMIANYTSHIHLGPGVTNPYLIHPSVTAQSVASLNDIAPGRIMCGIGAGDKTTLNTLGLKRNSPLRSVRETVGLIRHQLNREKTGYNGRLYSTTPGARLNFKVKQEIPVYVGAQGPKMLKLAGEIGDGVLINATKPDDVKSAVKRIEEGVEKAGKTLSDIDVAVYTSLSIDDKEDAAKDAAKPVVAYLIAGCSVALLDHHSLSRETAKSIGQYLASRNWAKAFNAVDDKMLNTFSICGTTEQCTSKIEALFKAGVNQFVVGSPLGVNIRKSISLLGSKVLPYFQ